MFRRGLKLLRRTFRHAALSLLATSGRFYSTPRALGRARIHFLYFHHLFPDEEKGFSTLLEQLSAGHEFLTYGEAVRRCVEGPIDRPAVAFSFDDGIDNCMRAAQILEEHGARACFFVPTRIIGESRVEIVEAFSREQLNNPGLRFMGWDELRDLKERGHEIGGHTHGHVNLAELDRDGARREIDASYRTLAKRLGEPAHFAWPYGRFRHFSAAAARFVFAAGYRSCASAEDGSHVVPVGDERKLCVRRRHLIASWPLSHQNYLIASGAARSTATTGSWPAAWSIFPEELE